MKTRAMSAGLGSIRSMSYPQKLEMLCPMMKRDKATANRILNSTGDVCSKCNRTCKIK